jgi:hypothetical protein
MNIWWRPVTTQNALLAFFAMNSNFHFLQQVQCAGTPSLFQKKALGLRT